VAAKFEKWKGRVEGAADRCGVPGCTEPGEFRAPLSPADFDGPGRWHYLCLDHVRAHNARYNYFAGMSSEEIQAAQSPIAGWERASRPFATGGADPGAAGGAFNDPLDAIPARVGPEKRRAAVDSVQGGVGEALGVMGLKDDIDRHALRQRYSELVRRYHPDRNGGDRSLEAKLRTVIEAYQTLKGARAFA
jgi:hypothetical protein